MFFGQFERESLYGEIWSVWQTTKLPEHLQLLVDREQVKYDIWELQSEKSDSKTTPVSRDRTSSDSQNI
ncbi:MULTISPECIES: hypothetical protein [Nostoc]|uniref:Uncharacterized protein n=1 Tax=Nostoc paludosum FACHB-159 TaxID=2692908 RepID=A0ABR8K0P1_9NOSO|nr:MULTISPECIES: hypothetical protein [Nostoc]MBD2677195.1 hypothetical protein [Nostoc sp. FACHB-857]MBD2732996.1 hypothetical protein [Nostoc paludosum FACHB-159]